MTCSVLSTKHRRIQKAEKKDESARRSYCFPWRKIFNAYNDCKTSREMWTKLSNIYQRKNEQQKYILMQEFFNYIMSKNEDVSTHVSKLQNIVHRIKTLGQEITKQIMLISKILVTLPENYKSFAWESTPEADKTVEIYIKTPTGGNEKSGYGG